jgi:signal transduction histidine kinase
LSLVRRIARAHGGDATIENRTPGPGAVATLSVPCADTATPNSQAFRDET